MRTFTIAFALENDAFMDSESAEVARILTEIARFYVIGLTSGGVRDINGNLIGAYVVEENK